MTSHNPSYIYDHPAKHMTSAGLFRYIGIDIIPLRDTSGDQA